MRAAGNPAPLRRPFAAHPHDSANGTAGGVSNEIDGEGADRLTQSLPPQGDAVVRATRSQALRLLPLGFMTVTAAVTYAIIVWTLPRGFDWTDEAFVDSMIASNRIAIGEPWGFQHLLNPLYVLTGESVLALRVLRLGGYVLLSVALVVCARAILHRIGIAIGRSSWLFIFVLAQVGTFTAWSYPPRYLSQNELSSWFSQVGIALALLSLAWGVSGEAGQRATRALWAIWVGLGAVAALLVFTKVTSGAVFAVVLAAVLLVPNPQLRRWTRTTAAGAGAAAVLLMLWVSDYPVGSYVHGALSLFLNPSAQAAFDHPISAIVVLYRHSLLATGSTLLPVLLLFTLTIASLRRATAQDGSRDAHRLAWVFGAFLLFALLALPKASVWDYLGALVVFSGLAGVVGLALHGGEGAALHGSTAHRVLSVAAGGLAVVSAPLVSTVGTNNSLTGQFLFAATLWAVVLGVALVLISERAAALRGGAQVLPALIGCAVLLMGAQAVKTSADAPYRTTSLWSQNTPTSAPAFRGILLTKADAEWMNWMSSAGDSMHAAGVPAIAISSPGALYAFNQSGYANPRVDYRLPVSVASIESACKTDPPHDLFVLQPGTSFPDDPSTIGTVKSLAACGISFPHDFVAVAQRKSADPARALTIWRLDSR